ncbi:hypothetical protein TRFO_38722 [Tritrichomonas foetus]|uniref:Uncharacterized protein n=1 Tax=Tritrichomonas foetus TaxID=1144522 RepID=A0A1J4J767_9EUKA|nr:hypothetical protein TRFO_38722 [Tritrichomonas foetus]|eukprot:OHS95078.1 hypothetical protein TRFO_38722 [Tritrichomonas foetus]
MKNVECIKDLFFKAEPLRLHVNDIEDKLSNLIADFKKATAASDNKINQLNQRFEEKMDSDYIVRVFDKCNKQVKQLTEIVTRLEKKVDDRNTRSVNSLGIDHTISNTSSANNINYNKNRNSQIEAPNNNNENSPISMPEKSTTKKSKNGNINIYISPEPAIVSRHTSPTRAQLSSLILSPPQGQHSKAYSNHGQHGKQVHHTPNTTKTKPKSQMQQLQTYQKGTVPAKSAEITPRGRYKIKLPGINKPNEQALASTSLNSPHRE